MPVECFTEHIMDIVKERDQQECDVSSIKISSPFVPLQPEISAQKTEVTQNGKIVLHDICELSKIFVVLLFRNLSQCRKNWKTFVDRLDDSISSPSAFGGC